MADGRGEEAARRCLRTAAEVDELAGRLRRLRPEGWSGPTARLTSQALLRTGQRLEAAGDALRRAAEAARRLGLS